jgi:hypothetical protein
LIIHGLDTQFYGFKAKLPGKVYNLARDSIRTCGAANTMDLALPNPWLYRLKQCKDSGFFQPKKIAAEKSQFHPGTIFFKLKIGMDSI